MLKKEVLDPLNEQINANYTHRIWYLSMSAYFEIKDCPALLTG
jgi:ferritin